ncbi:MAG: hypothetical protein L0332_01685 [Chloroflexi bacterium]|nr:hypothetical protein [Chloroflexota bacterium]
MADLNRIYRDIIAFAALAEVTVSEAKIEEALRLFDEGFAQGSVQFRTTTKLKGQREVNFRYTVGLDQAPHPQDTAQGAGLLTGREQEDQLLSQIRETFPLRRGAADFDVNHGLVKIWHFPKPPFLLERIFQIPALPRSVVAHADFFQKYHFDTPPIIGVDYLHHSMNLYFVTDHPEHHTPGFVKSILQDQQFEIPSDLIIYYCTKAVVITTTFRWDSPRIERMCFYVTDFGRRNVPSLHPLLTRLAQEATFLGDTQRFQVDWSFGEKGSYMKVEIDYTGDISI